MAIGISLALSVALTTTVAASGDAPVHGRYVATARCFDVAVGHIPGIPVVAIMRDDEDAIDAAVQRFADLGGVCLGAIDVSVVYIP
jgi:hypothetical protein